MDHKKDIGNLFKDRFQGAEKAPDKNLWDRLDNTLEKRDKKRRVAAWLWYGSAGLLLILFVSAVFFNNQKAATLNQPVVENTEENKNLLNVSAENSEVNILENYAEKNNDVNFKIGKQKGQNQTGESSIPQSGNVKDLRNKNNPEASGEIKNKNEPQVVLSKNRLNNKAESATQKTQRKKETLSEEGLKITTTYNYYNSETDTASVHLNQIQMDSLIKANTELKAGDSISNILEKLKMANDTLIEQ